MTEHVISNTAADIKASMNALLVLMEQQDSLRESIKNGVKTLSENHDLDKGALMATLRRLHKGNHEEQESKNRVIASYVEAYNAAPNHRVPEPTHSRISMTSEEISNRNKIADNFLANALEDGAFAGEDEDEFI